MDIFENVVLACKSLDDMKATNIVVCDVSKVASIAKYFVLATSTSNVQGRAAANRIVDTLAQSDAELLCKEGSEQSDWVVLDYYDFVVHIMTKDVREYYNLDKLWGDGKNTKKFETIQKELEQKAKKAEKKSAKKQKVEQKTAAKKESKEKKATTKAERKKSKEEKTQKPKAEKEKKTKKSNVKKVAKKDSKPKVKDSRENQEATVDKN